MKFYTEQKVHSFCKFFYRALCKAKIPEVLEFLGISLTKFYYNLITVPYIVKTYYIFLKQKDNYLPKSKILVHFI